VEVLQMLDIETTKKLSKANVNMLGELDISTVEKFRQAVDCLMEDCTEIIINFEKVEFVDSTGVGSLVQIINKLKAQDISFKIADIPQDIYEVFDLLGIPELVGQEYFICL
jgi:anti-anti-sigma factor